MKKWEEGGEADFTYEEGIQGIIDEFELSPAFPRKVVEESEGLSDRIGDSELKGRVDLRRDLTVTIDGEDAKDFDDAVSIERLEKGYCLKVSIADVSHFVLPGNRIDQEAMHRATSTYFADRVMPMLPERLSNNLCSLVPHKDRLTFTADMTFDDHGRRIDNRFYKSVIHSAARLTYTLVHQIVEARDEKVRQEHKKLLPSLDVMLELAKKIQAQRAERGSLDFDLPESKIEFDPIKKGKVAQIRRAARNWAHRLIEEFMISANEAVAEFIESQDCPSLYRVHAEPTPEKLDDFKVMIHNLGIPGKFSKRLKPRDLLRIIDTVRSRPEEKLVNTLMLRTMKQAYYDTKNIGHFGLASESYTHFTSPIRRYPDLLVHRILADLLEEHPARRGKLLTRHRNKANVNDLQQIARHCSEQERNSMKAEWASRDLAVAFFMQDKMDRVFEATIASVTKFGFFVELGEYFIQGLVSLKDLTDDYYVFHERQQQLVGRRTKKKYKIGDPLRVSIKRINLEKRWVDFRIVS